MQPLANERDGILPPALTEQTGSGPGRPHWDGDVAAAIRVTAVGSHSGRPFQGANHQHQDRQGVGHHRPALAARPRRRGHRIKRRKFITLLGGAVAAPPILWPRGARAQQPAMPVIGILGSELREPFATRSFEQEDLSPNRLRRRPQRSNIAGRRAKRPVACLAAELVRRQVTVIITPGSAPAALAARAATTTIPIVFTLAADPVAIGLVAGLDQPGGNLTV